MACYNTGYTGQNFCSRKSRFGKPTGLIFAKSTFSQTAANFLLQAQWIDAIQALNVFPLHYMKGFDDNSTEAQYHEYPNGSRDLIGQGDYRFIAHFNVNECVKKQLINFRNFTEGIYLVYGDVIRGRTTDSGTTIKPIRINQLNVEKATLPGSDGSPEMVKITVDLESDKDLNEYDYSREMAWDVKENAMGLTPVALSIVSASATTIVVDVSADCGGESKSISGLGTTAGTDFTVENSTTFTTVAESSTIPGRYTLTGTGFETGDVNIGAPADRSDDVMVISSGAVEATVS